MAAHTTQDCTSKRAQTWKDKVADDCSTACAEESIDAAALLALCLWARVVVVSVFAFSAVSVSASGA
jgi:hypothetical protein